MNQTWCEQKLVPEFLEIQGVLKGNAVRVKDSGGKIESQGPRGNDIRDSSTPREVRKS
jgi:hypothetical protein